MTQDAKDSQSLIGATRQIARLEAQLQALRADHDDRARKLADDIRARRNGLANEESTAMAMHHPTYVRAKKYRAQDHARINGMVIALSYMIGHPLDMRNAEEFIERTRKEKNERIIGRARQVVQRVRNSRDARQAAAPAAPGEEG